jgi:putative MATE family efflux protein
VFLLRMTSLPGTDHRDDVLPPSRSGWRQAVRDSLSGREHDYTRGSLNRAITLLAIPMVLELAMESLFAVCDIFFVGRLGSEAVATVGLTEAVLTLLYAVAIGLSMSTTAMVARRIGEQDRAGAANAAAQAIAIGLGVAIVTGVPGFLLGGEVLRLMGASPETMETGSTYASIMFGSNVVILFLFLNNAIFRGAGDPVVAMRSLWLANGVNIVLDPCLIFGWGPFPELGVTGAAVATMCGRGAGVIYQFVAIHRGASRIRINREARRLDVPVMLRLLRISFGGIAQMLVATASWVVLMRIMAPFGADAVAGYTIAVRIIVFAILPSWGLSNAAATLVGQNLGAGLPDRAARSVWLTGTYNMAFLAVVAVVFVSAAEPLVAIFNEDPVVLDVAAQGLRVISYGYVFYAWGMVMMQAFNGAGDTMTPTWTNLACFWGCQIPLAWFLARGVALGPNGVFWAVVLSETLLALLMIALFRRGTWRARVV